MKRTLLAAVCLAFALTAFAVPPVLTLEEVKTGLTARIAELSALPSPTAEEKKELASLEKARAALEAYTGANDKTDLKKGLAAGVKNCHKAASTDAAAPTWMEAIRFALADAGDTARADATTVMDTLVTEKFRAKVLKLIDKGAAAQDSAAATFDENPPKGAKLHVKATLKFQKAGDKAAKYKHKEGDGGNGGPVVVDSSALTFVLDPDGNPVPAALVGGKQRTGVNGVAVGAVTVSPGGWVAVECTGYATGYAEAGATIGVSTIYATRLTHLEGVLHLDTGESGTLTAGGKSGLRLMVDVKAADFASTPVTVGLAAIHPLDVGPLFEPLPGNEDHGLHLAFCLEARAPDGTPVELAAGATLVLELEEGILGDSPLLARFDSDAGAWLLLAGAARREGPGVVACDLSATDPLFGLFSPGDPHVGPLTKTAAEADLAFKLAHAELVRLVKAVQDQAGDPTTDPGVLQALADLAAAAREVAQVGPGEKAKLALFIASEAARSLGDDNLADALLGEATAFAVSIAQALVATDDCGRVTEMTAAVAQLQMLGGNTGLIDQLKGKIGSLDGKCDQWAGTVSIVLNIGPTHPALDEMTNIAGMGAWREDHFISVEIDGKGRLTGTDRVQHTILNCLFENEELDCTQEIYFKGVPGFSILEFDLSGSYDGKTFKITKATLASGNPPTIQQDHHMQMDDGEGGCTTITKYSLPFPNHQSLLYHGLYEAAPLFPLADLLNAGASAMSFANPLPEYGKYPFDQGSISWSFTRVSKE